MIIFRNSDGGYPRYKGDIQLVIPGWDFGDNLPEGWTQVVEVDPGEAPECLTPGRQNLWCRISPIYDEVNESWIETWEYVEGISDEPPDDGLNYQVDIDTDTWVVVPQEPEPEA